MTRKVIFVNVLIFSLIFSVVMGWGRSIKFTTSNISCYYTPCSDRVSSLASKLSVKTCRSTHETSLVEMGAWE